MYNLTYDKYLDCLSSYNIADSRNGDTLLAYFQLLSEKVVSPTLLSMYSMLRLMIITKERFHIKNYSGLCDFMKRKTDGYESKKSKSFTR